MSRHISRIALFAAAFGAMQYRAEAVEQDAGTVQAAGNPAGVVVNPSFNQNVDMVDAKFFFKKSTDAAGNDFKRPTVEIKMPRPSVEGVKFILENANTPEGQKALDLLFEAMQDVVSARARQILNDPANEAMTSEKFPIEELDWQKIANLPKTDRRESSIPKETWEEFAKDYIAIMPAITGKTLDKVALAAKVFLKKFSIGDVKQDKTALQLLRGQLALYISNTSKQEDFIDVVDYLDKRAEQLITAEPEKIGEAL